MADLKGEFICFTGAGGTGKTTTAARLVEMMPGYQMMTGVSRSVFKDKGIEREADQHDLTAEQRWELQEAIQRKYLSTYQELDGQKIISDRTHLCQTAYALQYCSTALDDARLAFLEQAVTTYFQYVRAIFYFPLCRFDGQDDGMRETREGPRVMYDALVRGLLYKYQVPHATVPMGTVDERATFIRNRLLGL